MGLWDGVLRTVFNYTYSSLNVSTVDHIDPLFQYFLIDEQKTDITLTSPVAIDDTVINVSSGHGFTGAAGEMIVIWENNRFLQQPVVSVLADAITVSTPISVVYTTGAIVVRGNKNMNVNGAVTPVTYQMRIQDFTIPIKISKIVITMTHGAAGDDGKFGGILALTNGVYSRRQNSEIEGLGNYKTNQDFKDYGGTVEYTSKGPGGVESTNIYYDLKQIFGQVKQFNASTGDVFISKVRDDLSTLTKFTTAAIGSYTAGAVL